MSYLPSTPPQSLSFKLEHILSNYSPPHVYREKGRTDSTAEIAKNKTKKRRQNKTKRNCERSTAQCPCCSGALWD